MKLSGVSENRWQQAQASEVTIWHGWTVPVLLNSASIMMDFLHEVGDAKIESLLKDKEVLEIGCGPIGISLASYSGYKTKIKRLVKAEPLPHFKLSDYPPADHAWAKEVIAWFESLASEGEYVQTPGEKIPFRSCFDTVICRNVLDHVQDPMQVLRNCNAALRDGGRLLLGVDCYSVVGRLRFEWITRRLKRGSVLVEAHPHTFYPSHLEKLLTDAGFSVDSYLRIPQARKLDWLLGKHFMAVFLATKTKDLS